MTDPVEAAGVELIPDALPGTDWNRALHHEDGWAVGGADVVDDRPYARQVGVAGGRRRRVDADHQHVGGCPGFRAVRREGHASAVAPEEGDEPGLMEGNVAAPQPVDVLLDERP